MNLYILVEGRSSEKKVYAGWLKHLFPHLTQVWRIEDVLSDHFLIMSGHGYPQYLGHIGQALLDVRDSSRVDELWICVDSEEEERQVRHDEIAARVAEDELACRLRAICPSLRIRVFVQHCCLETWLLGNRRIARPATADPSLRSFRQFFDVGTGDPETMGAPDAFATKAQFHFEYLRRQIAARAPKLSYVKTSPGPVTEEHFLRELCARSQETGHIASFGAWMDVCLELGGADLLKP